MKFKRSAYVQQMKRLGKELRLFGYKNYKEFLKSDRWKEIRIKIWQSDIPKRCYICGATEHLQVHHLSYKRLFYGDLRDVVFLCREHHEKVHEFCGRKNLNLRKGLKRYKKFVARKNQNYNK